MIPQIGPRMVVLSKITEMQGINKMGIEEHRECSMTTITQSNMSSDLSSVVNMDLTPIVIASSQQPNIIFNGNEDILSFLRPKFEDFDLKTLLQTSPLGKSVLNYYNVKRRLDNTRRNRLVTIIIKHLYNYIVKNSLIRKFWLAWCSSDILEDKIFAFCSRLSPEEYNMLGAKIIILFPSETLGIYYCPAIRKADHPLNKSVMAKGKLVNQARNILFRSGDTVRQRNNKRKIEELEVEDRVVPQNNSYDSNNGLELLNDDVVCLKHNTEPWNKIVEKWKNTYPIRKSSNLENVSEYFKFWPVLLVYYF